MSIATAPQRTTATVFALRAIIALLGDVGEHALNLKNNCSPLCSKLSAELFGLYADATLPLLAQKQTPEDCFVGMGEILRTMSNRHADLADLEDKGPYTKEERSKLAEFFISHGILLASLIDRAAGVQRDPLLDLAKELLKPTPPRS